MHTHPATQDNSNVIVRRPLVRLLVLRLVAAGAGGLLLLQTEVSTELSPVPLVDFASVALLPLQPEGGTLPT